MTQMVDDAPRRHGHLVSQWLFIGLCAVVGALPMPFGGARPLALDIFALCIGFLLLASAFAPQPEVHVLRTLKGPFALLAIVIAYIALQSSPLTPPSWHHGAWSMTGGLAREGGTGSIAADPSAALRGLMRWLTYAGVFYLSFVLGRDAARARVAVKVIAICGMIYAAYGLLVFWSGNKTVLWFDKWTYLSDLTGPFVNRNSFATYLGLTELAALSELIVRLETVQFTGGRRDRTVTSLQFISENAWLLIGLFLIVTAQVLTHSRGGFVFTAVGVVVLLAAIWRTRESARSIPRGLALLVVAMASAAFLISGDRLVGRLMESGNGSFGRIEIFQATLRGIADNPILGSGLGSFPSVFPMYRTDAIPTGAIDKAHSDYLETILDLGLPAAMCFFAAMGWLIVLCIRGVMVRRRHAIFPCLGLAASTLVMLHATVDFSLQIPAVAATYLFLLGMGVAQSQPTRITERAPRPEAGG